MNRGKKMLLLMLALVLCIGSYLGVQLLSADTNTVQEESGTFALTAHTADELTGLTWQNGDETLAFTCTDGTWTVTGNAAYPLNQSDVQAMADDLLALTGSRQLDGVTSLADYGLAEPSFTVTAAWADGTSTAYAMGDETPFGDGRYLSLGQEGIVYTVDSDLSDIFDTTLSALAVLDTIPTVDSAVRLTVGDTLDVVKEETSRSINAGELWYDNATGLALDGTAVEKLVTAAKGIEWDALADATASDEALTTYGVDEASATVITLYTDADTAGLTLLIGGQNNDGDYYARLSGSAMVCTVAASDLSSLLSASAEAMPSMTLIDVAEENLLAAAFTAGEYTHTWQPVHETEEASAEEAEEAASDETGEALWSALTALKADSRLDASADGTTLLTVEITTVDGQSAVMTFTEYDAEAYAVNVLDRTYLVDAADVDAIIRSLRAANK